MAYAGLHGCEQSLLAGTRLGGSRAAQALEIYDFRSWSALKVAGITRLRSPVFPSKSHMRILPSPSGLQSGGMAISRTCPPPSDVAGSTNAMLEWHLLAISWWEWPFHVHYSHQVAVDWCDTFLGLDPIQQASWHNCLLYFWTLCWQYMPFHSIVLSVKLFWCLEGFFESMTWRCWIRRYHHQSFLCDDLD